ncbi:amino acid ABC transporter permease [Parasalinivibrio latis]|uniref:amino acid ABC transporter permease n=1 Tax=Parasalinivibrio latis TaxID=2952610 RepID=UPI0030DF7974
MSGNEFVLYDLIVLLSGIAVSLKVFLLSSIYGAGLGLGLAICRYYRIPVFSQISVFISEFLKNSPVLVQLFLIYFGLPIFLSMDMSAELAAIITLTGNTAAFVSVIVITGMSAIDRGQLDAARSFGITEFTILKKIIAPQALLIAIAPLVGLAVNQLQVTSLISVIGVIDITKVGAILNQRTWQPFIVWPIIGLIYFSLSMAISKLGSKLEQRLKQHQTWSSI